MCIEGAGTPASQMRINNAAISWEINRRCFHAYKKWKQEIEQMTEKNLSHQMQLILSEIEGIKRTR